ncbi:type 4 prepilin-like proteins leader peptide-processing enzyme [Paenibacillus marchantiophytorum]|uniref:Type 4 prepilin-like proteins leader peptide-processing enzyme n=1 Tax=Paenibacillus marchantiophytorum TaxID=1619310 RepID=A0ABQ1EUS9_9BACL|nr:A24 family peptidase [Paenibacillus marchantiophytorum]GFZ88272.1 type 4 prepilin-like proteins leader peptide-processing enzyme [Paenibacillus marchantiophytorum]
MTILIVIYVFIVGLVLGSFFNVVALRVPAKQSIIRPPSACPKCETQLKSRDLLPVISYLWTRGKCRYCASKVSLLYPLGELVTGLLFVWVYLHVGFHPEAILALLLVSLLIIITVSDLTSMLIPNKILLFFLPFLAGLRFVFPGEQTWWSYALGAVIGCGLIVLISILSRGGMGMGDAKLLLVCGLVLGLAHIVVAFILACLIGTLIGGLLLMLKIIKRKQPIPFGPYLALGILISYGYGSDLIKMYVTLLG